ncbi:DNA adenine methylase [Methylobacterium brachiatum]|uniref:DNA adenine methylase n=1 Tax=Methylobacterium brachiatum TaxID=269660 RepID=UPI0008E8D56F|nr:DNA adenine methylase [Methylobacterium brachiatum]SFI18237.1 adenine-specific DNA-methyltransferase [Methylobacterium brachiatum]
MVVPVTYMGTKRQLAEHVKAISNDCQPGPFLDAFAGMGSVGTAIGASRPVWSNDKQKFACMVAEAQFKSRAGPPDLNPYLSILQASIDQSIENIDREVEELLIIENKAVELKDLLLLSKVYDAGRDRKGFPNNPEKRSGVFLDRYAGTYFGFRQCLEIDAVRIFIEKLFECGIINADGHRWLIIGLAAAISRTSTTTGHFAQPLKPKHNNLPKFVAQRKRSIQAEFIESVKGLRPIGTSRWRRKNKVFAEDAERLIGGFRSEKAKPSVIYADPPYTKDQYSRFYHVYETLVLNDFPEVSGEGLYRNDRFTSQYSLASLVDDAIETLIAQCAEINAGLILSYPTNGLLDNSVEIIPSMFKRHYGSLPSSVQLPHVHSTLGGSKGKPRSAVTEVIYWVPGAW